MEYLNLSCSMNTEPDIIHKMIKMKLFSFKDKLENGSRLLVQDCHKKVMFEGKSNGHMKANRSCILVNDSF